MALDRASDEVRLGTWYCEPYCDTINDYPYDEFMYILEGTVELQYPGGSSQTFGPGSALILPKGFSGVWKQDEPMLKYFVMIK
ncbi:hypothetical protein RA20_20925 [Leisingera sp. ANG-Vp]|nr:hypothetical protein RA20_20925 [Leisingera sp. ANG-Vp]